MTADPGWRVERVVDPAAIDDIMTVSALAFVNPWTRAMLEAEIARPERSFLFAARRAPDEVAGFCATWIVADELHINTLAVHPAWRRRGAARALLRHAGQVAVRRGATRATLEVRASNAAARRLYAALGFEEHGRRRAYYRSPPEDAVVLGRALESTRPV